LELEFPLVGAGSLRNWQKEADFVQNSNVACSEGDRNMTAARVIFVLVYKVPVKHVLMSGAGTGDCSIQLV
jgi:hypothetical protein